MLAVLFAICSSSNGQVNAGNYLVASNRYEIKNTVFLDHQPNGCISITSKNCAILVSYVTLATCKRTGKNNGGGMFLQSFKSAEFDRVCGNDCSSGKNGQVIYAEAGGKTGYTIKAEEMASCLCGEWPWTGFIDSYEELQDTFGFTQGNQSFRSFNSSTNNAVCDGAAFESYKSSSVDLKYCSFLKCKGIGIFSLYAYYSEHNCEPERYAEYVNIYNNTVPTKSSGAWTYGLFTIVGKWYFKYVVVKSNHDTKGGTSYSVFNFGQALKAADAPIANAFLSESALDIGLDKYGTTGRTVVLENCREVNDHTTQRIIHWYTYYCPAEFSATFTPYQIDYGHPIFSAMFSAFAVTGEL